MTELSADEMAELQRQALAEKPDAWMRIDPKYAIAMCEMASMGVDTAVKMAKLANTIALMAKLNNRVACEQTRLDTIAECIAVLKKEREAFLSEEYAYPQPIGSLSERFACDECIKAIEALAEAKS